MASADPTRPFGVAGIQNFGWVEPGLLARGEQPPLEHGTFESLRELGIRAVVSLRPDREPPSQASPRPWPEYRVAEEQAVVEAAGLRFSHAPLEDFSAPSPADVAAALRVLETELARAPAVYVHCRAGAGRAALMTSAWAVSRGQAGDRAAELYERFMEHLALARGLSEGCRRAARLARMSVSERDVLLIRPTASIQRSTGALRMLRDRAVGSIAGPFKLARRPVSNLEQPFQPASSHRLSHGGPDLSPVMRTVDLPACPRSPGDPLPARQVQARSVALL